MLTLTLLYPSLLSNVKYLLQSKNHLHAFYSSVFIRAASLSSTRRIASTTACCAGVLSDDAGSDFDSFAPPSVDGGIEGGGG